MGNPIKAVKMTIPGTKDFTLNPMDHLKQSLGMLDSNDPQQQAAAMAAMSPQMTNYQNMAAAAPNPQVQAAMAYSQALRQPTVAQPVPTGPQGQQYGARVAAPQFAARVPMPPPKV